MKKTEKTILLTGGFDPLHSGHIAYINEATRSCKHLTIGLNSDAWLKRKKGAYFMPFNERKEVLSNLKAVNLVIDFDDSDNSSTNAIYKSLQLVDKVIFANGGDRNKSNIPEYEVFKDNLNVEFSYEIGGSRKKNSSSLILENYLGYISSSNNKKNEFYKEDKPWGYYEILLSEDGYKLKRITVRPNQRISLQFHNMRSEHWIVAEGKALITIDKDNFICSSNEYVYIPTKSKHRIENIADNDLVFIELCFGAYLEEDDIVRIDDDYNRGK
jgi:cytidyltransferase-like protein